MTAMGILNTLETICSVMESQAEVLFTASVDKLYANVPVNSTYVFSHGLISGRSFSVHSPPPSVGLGV